MNIAIVDDRKTDSDRLVGFIDTYAEQHRLQWGAMDRFSSGEEFLGAFTAGKYDLIFLDIYMDGITGMETAVAFRTKCKIFSRHLQKPILKKKKDVLKGCKIPSKTSFSYCFFFGFRFPCSSTIRSFPVILC